MWGAQTRSGSCRDAVFVDESAAVAAPAGRAQGHDAAGLGDHLLTYRILGATSGGGEDLFATFWRAAPPDLRRQVLTDVGWSLEKTPELEPEVRERLVATWEWIYDEASGGETAPLAGFGAWLGTAALNGAWVLAQARAVLELDVHLEPDFVVYRALPRLAREHPREVVEVLRRMVLTDAEGWSLHGSTDEGREALRIALGADDAETRGRAEALVHLLGASGMTVFRDLVSAHERSPSVRDNRRPDGEIDC